jgi:peptidoglycan/xylan/chitin deacetylase (PgdA/CDA1 family)
MKARTIVLVIAVVCLLLVAACPGTSTLRTEQEPCRVFTCVEGGIIRGPREPRQLALIFTGGEFGDGGTHIRNVLKEKGIQAGFFFTGDFYRNPKFEALIKKLKKDGHYLGPHSDKHLLYCDWNDRDKTLVGRDEFRSDILANYEEMVKFGIVKDEAPYFIPPYEWYNRDIVHWSRELGLILCNFTPGTSSNADYTTPSMPNYLSSQIIFNRILSHEKEDPWGLGGFILLLHVGTDPERTDKFYMRLGDLIDELRERDYSFSRIDELLRIDNGKSGDF